MHILYIFLYKCIGEYLQQMTKNAFTSLVIWALKTAVNKSHIRKSLYSKNVFFTLSFIKIYQMTQKIYDSIKVHLGL